MQRHAVTPGRLQAGCAVLFGMTTHPRARNPNWKGGRTVASNGYVLIRSPGHPMADSRGYVYEHRLVMSEAIGRALEPGEQVHHRNGDKTDNRPENLELTASRADHTVRHRTKHTGRRTPGEPNPSVPCACGCGDNLTRYDAWGRPRRYISGHNTTWLPTPNAEPAPTPKYPHPTGVPIGATRSVPTPSNNPRTPVNR